MPAKHPVEVLAKTTVVRVVQVTVQEDVRRVVAVALVKVVVTELAVEVVLTTVLAVATPLAAHMTVRADVNLVAKAHATTPAMKSA